MKERGEDVTEYSWGDDVSQAWDYAWYTSLSLNRGMTYPVGRRKPNGYGLYDMHGNVWEWVADWYDKRYYASSPYRNPQGPSEGTGRVRRGGAWSMGPVHSGRRSDFLPRYGFYDLGFRCAKTP